MCVELVTELNELRVQYRLGHWIAYDPQVMEQTSGRSSDHASIPHGQLLDHGDLRGKLKQAASSVRGALQGTKFSGGGVRHVGLQMAVDNLKSATNRDEKPHGAMFDPTLYPRTAEWADLEASVAAQEQRHERGASEIPETDVEARLMNQGATDVRVDPDIRTAYRRGDKELQSGEESR